MTIWIPIEVQRLVRLCGGHAFIEALNRIVRRECLSHHWLMGLEDAQHILDA